MGKRFFSSSFLKGRSGGWVGGWDLEYVRQRYLSNDFQRVFQGGSSYTREKGMGARFSSTIYREERDLWG